MATPKNSTSNNFKCGHTEAQIRERATSINGPYWSVRCLNGKGHQHDDQHPSAYYCVETGWYGCRVCGLKGFADDRDRPDWSKPQTRTYSNGTQVHRVPDGLGGKRYFQTNIDSQISPKPYHHETILESTRTIYIVEGEKCAEALQPHLDTTYEAVITSIQGSGSASKTDWSPVREAIDRECKIIFIPDKDDAGEKYILSVAYLLRLDKINVISLDEGRDDGYDIADWLQEGHTITDLPKPMTGAAKKTEGLGDNRPRIVRSSAYDREIGQLSLNDRIDSNKAKTSEMVEWLIRPFVAAGQATVLYGAPGSGKSTVTRALVKSMIEGIDPFDGNDPQLFDGTPGRVLWWMGEEHLTTTLLKFDSVGIDRERCDILDRDFDWNYIDELVVEPDGTDHFRVKSPYTQLLDRIDVAQATGQPYRAIIIDSLPQIIGDTNKADVFERRWKEIIVPLERRNVAVIAIAHPRKDNPTNASLEASLKGTERLFSLPRLVVYAQAAPTKDLLTQSKEREEGTVHSNPIRDRFRVTGSGELREDEGLIGVLVPLKNSHERPENLTAHQYSIIDQKGVGIAQFSHSPWCASDFDAQQLDGRSFGATVAEKYELRRREKLSEQEKLARYQLEEQSDASISVKRLLEGLFKEKTSWSATELSERLENEGFESKGGQVARHRRNIASYDPVEKTWARKTNRSRDI